MKDYFLSKLDWLVRLNIFLGLSLGFFGASIPLLFGYSFSWLSFFLILLMEFAMYNLNRLTDISEDKINSPERVNFFLKSKFLILFVVVVVCFLALFVGFLINLNVFVIVLSVLFFGFFYSVKLPLKGKIKRLKDIPLSKNLFIGLSWVLTVVLIPVFISNAKNHYLILFFVLYLFLRSIINTVAFDLRDLKGDRIARIQTIPTKLGFYKTLNFLHFFDLVSLILILFFSLINTKLLVLAIGSIYSTVYLYYYRKKKISVKFLCNYIIDGEFFFYGFLIILASVL